MKAGDKLYCHSDLILVNNRKWFAKGKYYIIIEIEYNNFHNIIIKDDEGDRNTFSQKGSVFKPYTDHFYTIQELRKVKLDKLSSL